MKIVGQIERSIVDREPTPNDGVVSFLRSSREYQEVNLSSTSAIFPQLAGLSIAAFLDEESRRGIVGIRKICGILSDLSGSTQQETFRTLSDWGKSIPADRNFFTTFSSALKIFLGNSVFIDQKGLVVIPTIVNKINRSGALPEGISDRTIEASEALKAFAASYLSEKPNLDSKIAQISLLPFNLRAQDCSLDFIQDISTDFLRDKVSSIRRLMDFGEMPKVNEVRSDLTILAKNMDSQLARSCAKLTAAVLKDIDNGINSEQIIQENKSSYKAYAEVLMREAPEMIKNDIAKSLKLSKNEPMGAS